jgi:hypothetical protein
MSDEHKYGSKTQQAGFDKDEQDATVREGARQAALEREKVLRAADDATQFASEEVTAAKAKETFWQRFKRYIDIAGE